MTNDKNHSHNSGSEGSVMKIAGKPDRRIQLVNKFGAGVGEKWVYYLDDYGAEKTVFI